jgi:hypothetical protein
MSIGIMAVSGGVESRKAVFADERTQQSEKSAGAASKGCHERVSYTRYQVETQSVVFDVKGEPRYLPPPVVSR